MGGSYVRGGERRYVGGATPSPGSVWPIGPAEGHPLVQLFVEVDDVAASVTKVEQLGGQIVIPPQMLPDGDRLAIVVGTEGLSLGLMQRRA
jgi:predicted enzyme related to lactoylglutathione lyase